MRRRKVNTWVLCMFMLVIFTDLSATKIPSIQPKPLTFNRSLPTHLPQHINPSFLSTLTKSFTLASKSRKPKHQSIAFDLDGTAEEIDNYYTSYVEPSFQAPDDDLGVIKSALLMDYQKVTRKAREIISEAREVTSFLASITEKELIELPVKICLEGFDSDPGTSVCLTIVSVRLYGAYARLEALVSLAADKLGTEPLIFYTNDLNFNLENGIVGETSIGLMADYPLNFGGDESMLTIKGAEYKLQSKDIHEGTFVTFSCNGLENIGMKVSFEFSRDLIKPFDLIRNKVDNTKRVSVTTFVENLNTPSQLYAELELDPFVVTGMEDFVWTATGIVIDNSELKSPLEIENKSFFSYDGTPDETGLPTRMTHEFSVSGDLWRGVFIRRIGVRIPRTINNSNRAIDIQAEHLIYDETGMSGQAKVISSPLISLEENKTNGWAMEVENIGFTVVQSDHISVDIAGSIHVPLLAPNTQPNNRGNLDYAAQWTPGNNLSMTTSFNQEQKIPLLIAEGRLKSNSFFNLTYRNGLKFYGKVFATVGIKSEISENLSLSIPEVHINGLEVRNYGNTLNLNIEDWQFQSSNAMRMGPFALELDPEKINNQASSSDSVGKNQKELNLFFQVSLGQSESLSGAGGITIRGNIEDKNGLQTWENNEVRVNSVCLNIQKQTIPGIDKLAGCLSFYDTETSGNWGDGFRGYLDVSFTRFIDQLTMIGQFGHLSRDQETKPYYLIDGSAVFSVGIPLGPGLYIKGIGGGFYRNMQRPKAATAFDQISLPGIDNSLLARYGSTMSGITYTPVQWGEETFGFRASTILSSSEKDLGGTVTFSGNLELGMEFKATKYKNGETGGYGIQSIYFQGVGTFMDAIDMSIPIRKYEDFNPIVAEGGYQDLGDKLVFTTSKARPGITPVNGAMVSAKVLIQAEFKCPSLHGIMGVYMDAGILYGKAVADLYVSKECEERDAEWHLYIGKAYDPIRLGIDIPIVGNLAEVYAYFMMGNEGLPDDVPPPQNYESIFGAGYDPSVSSSADNYQGVDYQESSISSGNGFATGMGMCVQTPEDGLRFLILKAHLQGGMGLDVLLKRFVRSDCASDIGINGWYSRGQAYLYAYAKIFLSFNLGIKEINIKLIEAGLGALLKMEGPNPFFARGRLDAILGSQLFDVRMKMKVKFGNSLSSYIAEVCDEDYNDSDNPIVDEVVAESIASFDGSHPASTNFIVVMNYEPRKTNRAEATEFEFDVIDKNRYQNIISRLQQNGINEAIVKAGFVRIMDEKDREIPYKIEYLNDRYRGSSKTTYKIRLIPQERLPAGQIKVKVPALMRIKHPDMPDILKDRKVNSWYYMEGQYGDPYVFEINDTISFVKLAEQEIVNTYPAKNVFFHQAEMSFIPEEQLKERGFQGRPDFMLTVSRNLENVFSFKSIPDGFKIVGGLYNRNNEFISTLSISLNSRHPEFQTIYFKGSPELDSDSEYRVKLGYQPNEDVIDGRSIDFKPMYEWSFVTSQYDTFKDKMEAVNWIKSDSDIAYHQWYSAIKEPLAEKSLYGSKPEGLPPLVSIYFDNERQQETTLGESKLLWSLFQDHNLCDEAILTSPHPKHDLQLKFDSEEVILKTNIVETMKNVVFNASEYVIDKFCQIGTDEGTEILYTTSSCKSVRMVSSVINQNGFEVYRPSWTDMVCEGFRTFSIDEKKLSLKLRYDYLIPFTDDYGIVPLRSSSSTTLIR